MINLKDVLRSPLAHCSLIFILAFAFIACKDLISGGRTQIAKPALTVNQLAFNGSPQTVTLTATNAAYTLSGQTQTNVGNYTATVTLTDTANYEWEDGTTEPLILNWSITYTVTFNSNGGSTVVPVFVVHHGDTITAPTPPTTSEGGITANRFRGWYKNNGTFAQAWDFATDTVTENITLYAEWGYRLGETGPGGGKIFYIADGQEGRPLGFTVEGYTGTTGPSAGYTAHYLEVASTNAAASTRWGGNTQIFNGLTNYAITTQVNDAIANGVIGNGRKDTQIIIAALGTDIEYAARSASAYTTDSGHTDWFLPSITELNLLYQSTSAVSGMPETGYFWSSSQSSALGAWMQIFDNDNQQPFAKNTQFTVRAMRAF